MPEGHYGAGFLMVEDKEGRPRGYFLTSDRYDDKKKPLATALLAALFPELGIETWQRLKSYGEVEMLVSRDDMEKYGAVAYVEASALIEAARRARSEEHTSELQSLMRISYAVFCLKKKNNIH